MDRTNMKHKYDAEINTHSKRRRITVEVGKKDTHNKCEQKGRQKINDKINELKDLLPECQNTAANKAAILRSAADSIKRFQFICYQLFASNLKIEEENGKIREEISRLRGAIGLPANEQLSSFDSHNGRGSGEPLIKPELVDPARFMSSIATNGMIPPTNISSMRPQDHHFNFLYSPPVAEVRPSYKMIPGSALFPADPSPYVSEEDEEEDDDDKDDDSSSPSNTYTWK